jgi:hypothetical protein
MPWEQNNMLLFAKFQPQKVDVNSWNFKSPFVCFKYYVDTCLFKVLKYDFVFVTQTSTKCSNNFIMGFNIFHK